MPTYEYVCQACATDYEERRPMDQADAPSRCPECGSGRIRRRLSTVRILIAGSANSAGGCACSAGGACACRAAAHN